ESPKGRNSTRTTDTTDSPGSQFNQAHQVADILEAKGWKEDRRTTLGMGWTRPGKESGTSAVLLDETGNLYVFSSNAYPLEPGQSYSSFALFTMYDHGGDFSSAARELSRQGYGEVSQKSQVSQSQTANEEWPEPSPLIAHRQADPYPLDALPGTIGAAVREVVEFVQCPVALGACSALAVVSTVAQGLVDVRRAGKLEGPTSLFLLAIADSGERKSTVDAFFSKPVAQWEAEQAEAAKPDLRKYEANQATWEAKKSGLLAAVKDAAKGGKSTTDLERKVADLEAEKPYPPKVPRLLFGDSTPEALAHRLAHGWPVGGVLSSEAGNVFGGHAMAKESAMRNMALLNSLWGAEPLTIDRRSVPSFTVRGARLTMGLAVQSETVRAFLESSKGLARGIGWLARFLIAWPESTQGGRMFKNPPETWPNLAKFHRRLGTLLDHPLAFNDQGELEPETLELSPEAKEEWVSFHDEVEAELMPGRDMAEAKDVASKAADNAARLAALFHLFENGPGGSIGLDHMKAAASLASWHLYEARRFMGEIALPAEVSHAAKLDAWLIGHCQQNRLVEVSTRGVQQLGPSCTREKRTLDPALEELAESGRVRVVIDGRRKLVRINPALLRG
ncbi:MAG: YfjI family protein, partial [Desulfurivibrionaceae bacterium]